MTVLFLFICILDRSVTEKNGMMLCKIGAKGPKLRWAMGEVALLTWIGVFAVLFSDVELPEFGGMVASAEATDEDASTDEVVLALVDVEDKTIEVDDETVDANEETNKEVTVG